MVGHVAPGSKICPVGRSEDMLKSVCSRNLTIASVSRSGHGLRKPHRVHNQHQRNLKAFDTGQSSEGPA